ncbi:MAG: hypothetical protein KAS32_20265 [Candidatus Peribacteraceae bacterium]|nr:hypothetical protein [Candidatus Peribacteraceae bacterium]
MKLNDMKVWVMAMTLGALGFVLAAGPAGAASAVKFMDETGTAYGVKQSADNVPMAHRHSVR